MRPSKWSSWRNTLAGAVLAGLGAFCCLRESEVAATPPAPTATQPAPAPPEPVVNGETTTVTTPVPTEPSTTARVYFTTIPPTNATVTWGKKLLGRITPKAALVVVRPRDSGPLDVIVRAPGYMPVTTRAHTFADSRVAVKLTTPDQKQTLLGYRLPLDAGVPLTNEDGTPIVGDAGVAPPPAL